MCFNPRPAFWPGVTIKTWRTTQTLEVSILARPFGRALRHIGMGIGVRGLVSILARPFGRRDDQEIMLVTAVSGFQSSPGLLAGRYDQDWLGCPLRPLFQSSPGLLAGRYFRNFGDFALAVKFQSSPGLLAGRDRNRSGMRSGSSWFQSSPGLLAGRYLAPPAPPAPPPPVSILARPFGRALPVQPIKASMVVTKFQSSPGLLAGRYRPSQPDWTWPPCFNPRPAFWPGADPPYSHCSAFRLRFQSSPGLLAGRYSGPCVEDDPSIRFQSSPGLLAGRYPMCCTCDRVRSLVSILAWPFGRA